MLTGPFVAAILALLTSNGIVVSADSKDTPVATGTSDHIALIGNRCAIGATGPAGVVFRPATGGLVNYSLRNLIDDLTARLPKNPPPSVVAKAAKEYLAKAFAPLPPLGLWPDVYLLVAGIEPDGKPVTYAVRASLTARQTPVPVAFGPLPMTPGKPYPAGFGVTSPKQNEKEPNWTSLAPQKLVHEDRLYSLTELADIAGLMLKSEAQTNKKVTLPVEQVFLGKDAKPRRRLWTKPE
jgi:hypothetical protein